MEKNQHMSALALACLGEQKPVQVLPVINLCDLEQTYKAIAEEQRQTGGTIQYRVKIPAGGGKSFDVLTGDDERDMSVSTFAGVIVYHHKCNARFDESGEDVNTPPVCASVDGIQGVDQSGEARTCAGCQFNAYGTGKGGRGKACKNMHKLYIMTPGVAIPLVLCLPPTSLKNVQGYLLNVLAARRLKPWEVLTEFSIAVAQNANGVKYSTVKFKLLGQLNEDDRRAAEFFATGLKFVADVAAEDYNREPVKPSIDVEPNITDFPEDDFPFPADT